MSRIVSAFLVLGMVCQGTYAGAKAKVLDVPKDGLKIEGAVKADDPKVNVKLNEVVALDLVSTVYLVKLSADKNYRIALNRAVGDNMDPFVVVQDKDGKQLAFNDDGGGNLNSLLTFTPPASGTYKIYAADLTNAGGKYTLSVEASAPNVVERGKELEVPKDGLKIEGALKAGDPKVKVKLGEVLALELISRGYSVKLSADKKYTITLDRPAGDSMDPFVVVQDKDGKQLAYDDDGGGNLNSLLTFTPPATGTFRIYAADLNNGGGNFTLRIVEAK